MTSKCHNITYQANPLHSEKETQHINSLHWYYLETRGLEVPDALA